MIFIKVAPKRDKLATPIRCGNTSFQYGKLLGIKEERLIGSVLPGGRGRGSTRVGKTDIPTTALLDKGVIIAVLGPGTAGHLAEFDKTPARHILAAAHPEIVPHGR
jgi:hypothetical protein